MAKIEEPTVTVKVVGDTSELEAKMAYLEQRSASLASAEALKLDARRDALSHAVHLHSVQHAGPGTADDVVATAEKLHAFLLGSQKAVGMVVKDGGYAAGGLVHGTTLSPEAQAQMAKLQQF